MEIDALEIRSESSQQIERFIAPTEWRRLMGRTIHVELDSPQAGVIATFSSTIPRPVFNLGFYLRVEGEISEFRKHLEAHGAVEEFNKVLKAFQTSQQHTDRLPFAA
jgi:hypothetical protein